MPEELEFNYQVIPQRLIVYRRPKCTALQFPYKVDGVCLVTSTKKNELLEAIQETFMLLANTKVRKKQNFTVATKRFKDAVAPLFAGFNSPFVWAGIE